MLSEQLQVAVGSLGLPLTPQALPMAGHTSMATHFGNCCRSVDCFHGLQIEDVLNTFPSTWIEHDDDDDDDDDDDVSRVLGQPTLTGEETSK